MKDHVLFVASANHFNGSVSPIIVAQAESLRKAGINVIDYGIKGKGILGYLKNVVSLRKHIIEKRPGVIHAHYSFSGIVTYIAKLGIQKESGMIVSLMGSDVNGSWVWRIILKLFVRFAWKETIVKSVAMKDKLDIPSVHVIPNGVDTEVFRPYDKLDATRELGISADRPFILFGADPNRKVKNYSLAKQVYQVVDNPDIGFVTLGGVPHDKVPLYLSACDVMILTSLWEGSPNIVKEAMACNTPVVSVEVGDVPWLLKGVANCYVVDRNPMRFAAILNEVIKRDERSNGRDRILELGLDSGNVARILTKIYQNNGLKTIQKQSISRND